MEISKSKLREYATIGVNLVLYNMGFKVQRKVFAIGFNKTGTTSLHHLFLKHGFAALHDQDWRREGNENLLKAFNFFSDGEPKQQNLSLFDEMFPDSKFILQVRDLDKWIYSRLAHIKRDKMKGKSQRRDAEWDSTEYAIKKWIIKRNDYHRYTLNYFSERPSDLLVVNFIRDKRAVSRISSFVGLKDSHHKPAENVNKKKKIDPNFVEMVNNCREDMKIPEDEMNNDIYCPSLVRNEKETNLPSDTSMLI